MNIETELKFNLPGRVGPVSRWSIPAAKFGKETCSELIATYFDTKKYKLERRGLSLRVRRNGSSFVQTIKATPGASINRGEWENDIKDKTPDLKKTKHTPFDKLNAKKLSGQLSPIFRTSVRRATIPVHTRRSEIEIALDRGHIIAGRRSRAIAELELELKRGSSADLFQLAKTIAQRFRAELYLPSKADRGYRLARGELGLVSHSFNSSYQEHGCARGVPDHSSVRHFALFRKRYRRAQPRSGGCPSNAGGTSAPARRDFAFF